MAQKLKRLRNRIYRRRDGSSLGYICKSKEIKNKLKMTKQSSLSKYVHTYVHTLHLFCAKV